VVFWSLISLTPLCCALVEQDPPGNSPEGCRTDLLGRYTLEGPAGRRSVCPPMRRFDTAKSAVRR